MKITYSNPATDDEDDLAAEHAFDFTKAKPNRFAPRDSRSKMTVVVLGEDIAQVSPTSYNQSMGYDRRLWRMETTEIIKALPTLSIDDRLKIATIALDSIVGRRSTSLETPADVMTDIQLEQQLRIAANLAIDDYANDRELTIFSNLDGEDFLEYPI